MSNICYWCGRLTHDDRDCDLWIESEGTLNIDQREFGPQLRAPPFTPSKRNVLKVAGYYAEKKKTSPITLASQTSGKPPQKRRETGPKQSNNGDERYRGHINSPLMHNGLAGVNSLTETEIPQSYPANPDMEAAFKSPNDVQMAPGNIEEDIDERLRKKKFCDSAGELTRDSTSHAQLKHTKQPLINSRADQVSPRASPTIEKACSPQTWTRKDRSHSSTVSGARQNISG